MVPSTGQQLIIVILFVLPGVVYQAVRGLFRGPSVEDVDGTNRILRALSASLLLDTLYLMLLGPQLLRLVVDERHVLSLRILQDNVRLVGAVGILLLVATPTLLALAEYAFTRRRQRARYSTTPTAWDHLFKRQRSFFLRARLKDGGWVGGWYGINSAAAAYPLPGDLFVEAQYSMSVDGEFRARIPGTCGFYVRSTDIDVLEILGVHQVSDGST